MHCDALGRPLLRMALRDFSFRLIEHPSHKNEHAKGHKKPTGPIDYRVWLSAFGAFACIFAYLALARLACTHTSHVYHLAMFSNLPTSQISRPKKRVAVFGSAVFALLGHNCFSSGCWLFQCLLLKVRKQLFSTVYCI